MTALTPEDQAVAEKLGIGTPGEGEQQQQEPAEGAQDQGQESSTLEDLPESWQAEIRRLRAESAAARVKVRDAQKAARESSKAAPTAETPEAVEARVRESVRLEYGLKLAAADVKASLKGVVPDALLDSVVGKLDLSQYVGEDGTDTEAVKALQDEYTALLGVKRSAPKVGHSKTQTGSGQKTNAEQFAELFPGILT
jgi:hypothetical protein